MKNQKISIMQIPAIIWGDPSTKVYLYVHGQGGYKEEAEAFAGIASRHSCQVLSIDLPGHGERKAEADSFVPWCVVPELLSVMKYIQSHWTHVSLCANSIGAWFSLLGFESGWLEECLLVSPVLDMERLILNMMKQADVSEGRLRREQVIQTSFGQTLSWEYLAYTRSRPSAGWEAPTHILYGSSDHLIERSVVEKFAQEFNCSLTVFQHGEHWFHTQEQLDFLYHWMENCLQTG